MHATAYSASVRASRPMVVKTEEEEEEDDEGREDAGEEEDECECDESRVG